MHPNGCGLTEEMTQWMDHIQSSEVEIKEDSLVKNKLSDKDNKNKNDETQDKKTKLHNNYNNTSDYQSQRKKLNDFHDHYPHHKYSKEANDGDGKTSHFNHRAKRAARVQERNTCSLYIQTDPLIWKHIRESIPDVSIQSFCSHLMNSSNSLL